MSPSHTNASRCYSLQLPNADSPDARNRLDVRTGSTSCLVMSRIVVYGGLTIPLELSSVDAETLEATLRQELTLRGLNYDTEDIDSLISNEVFSLSLIERRWIHKECDVTKPRPQPRLFHSMLLYNNWCYIQGGLVFNQQTRKFEPVNDFWKFHMLDLVWVKLPLCGAITPTKRYAHEAAYISELNVTGNANHHGLIFVGGIDSSGRRLSTFEVFDLDENAWKASTNIHQGSLETLSLSEDRRAATTNQTVVSDENALMVVPSMEGTHPSLITLEPSTKETVESPLSEFPLLDNTTGFKLPIGEEFKKSKFDIKSIPFQLRHPNIGLFGDNIIVCGFLPGDLPISVFIYERKSHRWLRLNVFCQHPTWEHRFCKGFVWNSHHKIVLMGNRDTSRTTASVQFYNHMICISLPFISIFSGDTYVQTAKMPRSKPVVGSSAMPPPPPQLASTTAKGGSQTSVRSKSSFAAYSHYAAPQTKLTSIRTIFPPYAVTLGKSAYSRKSALYDFELISADGERVFVAMNVCRKRWGRTFDMLLARGYARALDFKQNAESQPESSVDSEMFSSTSTQENAITKTLSRSSQQSRGRHENAPQFRLPFQNSSSELGRAVSSEPPTRRDSVASGEESVSSTRSVVPSLHNVPPQPPLPSEPVPRRSSLAVTSGKQSPRSSTMLSPLTMFKGPSSSPRGSVSTPCGANSAKSPLAQLANEPERRLRSSVTGEDATFDAVYIPRKLYLPFSSATVRALAEYLYTGEVNSNWTLVPVVFDLLLISQFYELPLLHDLISEILYVVLTKKEIQLISMAKELKQKIEEEQKRNPDVRVPDLSKIDKFTRFLTRVDDGTLDLELLKRASRDRKMRRKSKGSIRSSITTLQSGSSKDDEDDDDRSSEGETFRASLGLVQEEQRENIDRWPTLRQLATPTAEPCSEMVIDLILEAGILSSDNKIITRTLNVRSMLKQLRSVTC